MGDLISRSALREEHLKRDFFPAITRHLIDNAPAVDAVPVVHGRWVERHHNNPLGGYFMNHCSVCGMGRYEEYNYCPNCGTKMDGGNDG